MERRQIIPSGTSANGDTGLDAALQIAMTSGLPFSGLRNRAIDYRLFSYVPFELAQREALLPLSLEDDTLTVAAASGAPDLSEIQTSFPALPVRVVIAPGQEIRRILDQVKSDAA